MKRLHFLIILAFMVIGYSQAENINIKGFGEIPVSKQGDSYLISIGSYGEFAFQGSLNPLELKSSVTIEQLNKLPGFKVLSNLGLKDVSLGIYGDGAVLLSAQADTKSSLDKICKLFKITTPYIGISAAISPKSIELEGALEFTDGAVELMHIDQLGTSVKFSAASISTTLEPGSAELGITTELLIKPTESDPELESIYSFSYDIISQTLTGAGSMMTEWSNPLGSSKFLKENSIVFSNAAVELGINMATLAPVNLGFAMERGKLFTLDFGVVASIDPVDKKVAFLAERTKMNANDFTTFLREGFGLTIPDVLPDIYYIDQPYVKFAPNGGSVGEVEIEKGICLDGNIKIGDAIEGPIHFYFDMENEFILHMDLDLDIKKFIMNEVHKVPGLNKVADNILNTFQVHELYVDMYGNKTDLQMKGNGMCRFEVFGNSHTVELSGTLDAKSIANDVLNKIKEEAPGVVVAVEKVGQGVQEAGKLARSAISSTSNIATKYIKLGSTKAHHIHPFDGGEKYCRAHCIPDRANNLANQVLPSTTKALQLFYDRVIDDLVEIEGGNDQQTKILREDLFLAEWNNLVNSTDGQWNEIREDKEYIGFFVEQKWAENGGNQFRGVIDERKKEYNNLKDKLYNSLISARLVSDPKCVEIKNRYRKTRINIENGSVDANKIVSESFSDNWIIEEIHGTNFVRFKNRLKGTYLNIEQGKLDSNPMGIGAYSAMWELIPVGDTHFKQIRNRWKTNLYLHQEGEKLECSTIKPGWHSAMWELNKVSYTPEKKYDCRVWSTNGDQKFGLNSIVAVSNNRKYELVFQIDGNLVLYKYGNLPLWSSNTYNKGASTFKVQKDGNLVIYNNNNQVLWASNSYGKGGETLFVQDDGNMVIHAPGSNVVWASNTIDNTVNRVENMYGSNLKIKNAWKYTAINIENGITCGNIAPGWYSARWIIESAGDGYVKIKNVWKNTYLNIEGGMTVQCSDIQQGWHSAMWKIEPIEGSNHVRIKNRWKGTYLNIESGGLQCTDIQPGWASALWLIEVVQ